MIRSLIRSFLPSGRSLGKCAPVVACDRSAILQRMMSERTHISRRAEAILTGPRDLDHVLGAAN